MGVFTMEFRYINDNRNFSTSLSSTYMLTNYNFMRKRYISPSYFNEEGKLKDELRRDMELMVANFHYNPRALVSTYYICKQIERTSHYVSASRCKVPLYIFKPIIEIQRNKYETYTPAKEKQVSMHHEQYRFSDYSNTINQYITSTASTTY